MQKVLTMVIAIVNQKGGVAKSTTTLNLASGLAKAGKKILCIDLDAQSSLTDSVGIAPYELETKDTIFGTLKNENSISEVVQTTSLGFDIVPASIDLASADLVLGGVMAREKLLTKALKDIRDEYDLVLLDCPPSLGIITVNALTCANKLYIPSQPELLCIKGVALLMDSIENVQEDLNPDLEIGGVIITLYEKNRNAVTKCVSILDDQFGELIFKTKIRKNVKVSESPFFNKCVIEYDSSSIGADDYLNLTKEVIEREGI
jgi:chromosome partitioning protein